MNRYSYARLVFGYFLILVLYKIQATEYLFSLKGAPLKGHDVDYAYLIFLATGFPQYIISHTWTCVLFDAGSLLLLLACLFSDKYRHWFVRFFILFFFIQRLTLEIYANSHTKSTSCLLFAFLPFCFKDDDTFELLVGFGRYFLLFILISAAYHKLTNGALLTSGNFVNQLINQHTDLAILQPTHISYKVAHYLILHPVLANFLFKLLWVAQLTFIAGIFTKQYDRFLWIILIAFAVSTYFIMRIYNFDITVLGWSLWFYKIRKSS